MALTVPRPTLTSPGATGSQLAAEQPITLACGPVTFPDGAALSPENVAQTPGYLLFREGGGAAEVWNEQDKAWAPEQPAPARQEMFPKDGQWQAILIGIGQKDRDGNEKLATNLVGGLPRYFVRCFFRGRDAQQAEHDGVSPPSQPVAVFAPGTRDRAGLTMSPKSPATAQEIRLFLKDAALTGERGQVVIRQSGGGFQVELVAGAARVVLQPNGDITLRPGAGGVVRVEGNLAVSAGNTISVGGVPLLVP
jgi:hypothetical protein